MLNQVVRTTLRAATKVLAQRRLPSFRVTWAENSATFCLCRQWDIGSLRYGHMFRDARQFCSRNDTDDSERDAGELHSRDALGNSDNEEISNDEDSDGMFSDHEIFEAFQSELAANDKDDEDDEEREAEAPERETQSDHKSKKAHPQDEQEWRHWNTKERVKACLDKLKKGPDGRYINVFDVATEVDMLIASYLKLRKQDDPDRAEFSDDDEKYLEGIDINKFKKLQKRLRDGTYKFQPIVLVPLPKRKIVKLKKKVKKQHAF